jgi:subtilase family serine protease
MAGGLLVGCSRGGSGPGELFLDSVVGAIATSGEPDLWVSSVVGPPSATSASGYFVTVTACNQGSGSAESAVKLYLSKDTRIGSEDTLVGSAPTGSLHPRQCTALHVRTSSPVSVPSGLWHLGAVIDPGDTVEEVSETNNTRAGARMAIGSGADLQLARVSAPAHLSPASRFEAAVEVCNTGTASGSSDVDVYLSADMAVTLADTWVGSGSTGPLREGQCTTLTIPATAQVPAGTWHVAAWVDRASTVAELVESNNTRSGTRVVVDNGPDFTVASVMGPDSLPLGASEPIVLTATVCNEGNVGAATQVEAYLSADSVVAATDLLVGSAPVEHLEPGQCAPVRIRGAASVSSGLWHVAAWVDRANTVRELAEGNNLRIGGRAPAGRAPDLTVASVSGPRSVAATQPVRATATVCNHGTAQSLATTASFFLSLDATITASDAPLGHAAVPELLAGTCVPVELSAEARVEEGAWYVGAFVDGERRVAELSESNNARAGTLLGVGDGADLYVSSVIGPTWLREPRAFTGHITVCNQGTRPTTEAARVGLFLSTDTAITASDTLIGDAGLPALAPGQCAIVSVPEGARLPEGTWHLGAIADLYGAQAELIKDNNARVGGTVSVGSTVAALHAPAASRTAHN